MAETYKAPKGLKLKRMKKIPDVKLKSESFDLPETSKVTGSNGEPSPASLSGDIDLKKGVGKKLLRKKSKRDEMEEETNEAGQMLIESERLKNEKKMRRILDSID